MIYVDEIRHYPKLGYWSHMWSSTGDDEELDNFAVSIGLRKSWAHTSQGEIGRFYHYDIRPNKRLLALEKGAQEVGLKEYINAVKGKAR